MDRHYRDAKFLRFLCSLFSSFIHNITLKRIPQELSMHRNQLGKAFMRSELWMSRNVVKNVSVDIVGTLLVKWGK